MACFKDISIFISSMLFPNHCIFCNEPIDPFEDYCENCGKSVPFIKGEICTHCGAAIEDCDCNKRKTVYYDKLAAPLYYDGDVKSCIHRFKFKDERQTAKPLARLMSNTLKEHFGDIKFDYVTYIPMYRTKERKRGFNQSRLLATEISKLCDIPFADKLIIKLYDTDNQHDCTGLERTGNLIGVFDVDESINLADKTILLIDDIKTSGATLNECGKILYLNDVKSVICLTAAVRNSKIEKKYNKQRCNYEKDS